nr:rabphilin-3A-like [Rattus norvegicus]
MFSGPRSSRPQEPVEDPNGRRLGRARRPRAAPGALRGRGTGRGGGGGARGAAAAQHRPRLAAAQRRYTQSLDKAPGDPPLGTHQTDSTQGVRGQASSLRSPLRPEGRLPAPTASEVQGSSGVMRPGPRPSSALPPARPQAAPASSPL